MDLAIDCKGHTVDARPGILARRPAAVQAGYLVWPGTYGASFIDYLLVDGFVVPPDERRYYDESLVYLPHSYQVNDDKRAVPVAAPTRRSLGLPDAAFVFACFNNNFKITPEVFGVWMRILKATPGSVLWLLADNDLVVANLRREAGARGLDPARLIFAPRLPAAEHAQRQLCADLFLDTFPCNAHTTGSDALWCGLPLITLAGRGFPSRVAASLLHAVGLPELVTTSLYDYELLALRLSADPAALARVGERLRSARTTCALFSTERTTRHLEAAYAMIERASSGRPACDLKVLDSGVCCEV